MKEIWKKYKLWISIFIYLAIATLFFIFVVMPLIARIKEISNETQQMAIDEEINRLKIAKLSDMREIHDAIQKNENNFSVMIDPSQEVEFIKKLESLAMSTGNKIEIKIDESNTGDSVNKNLKGNKAKTADDIASLLPYDKYLSIQLNLEGNYQNLIEFIYKLENFDYFVNVLSMSLTKDVKEENQKVSADIFSSSNLAGEKNSNLSKNILRSNIVLIAYIKKK